MSFCNFRLFMNKTTGFNVMLEKKTDVLDEKIHFYKNGEYSFQSNIHIR